MPTLCWGCACCEAREQAVAAELQQDWRNSTGGELAEVMGEHLPFYGNVIVSFTAAKSG